MKKIFIDVTDEPRHQILPPEPCITTKQLKRICKKMKYKTKGNSILSDIQRCCNNVIDNVLAEAKRKAKDR